MVAIDLAVSDLSKEDGALEWLLECSDLSERQKGKVRSVANDNLEGAIKLFYSMDASDAITFKAKRFGHGVLGDNSRLLDELVGCVDDSFDYELKDGLDYLFDLVRGNDRLNGLVEKLVEKDLSHEIFDLVFNEVDSQNIVNRLEMIVNYLEKSREIVVPTNIVDVNFDKDKVVIKQRRNFNKNPIDYYNRHHSEVRVCDLKKKDKSLYDSLVRYRQIHLIRNGMRRDLSDPVATFRSSYDRKINSRNMLMNIDPSLYYSLLKKNLLRKVIAKKFKFTQEERIKILLSYFSNRGDLNDSISDCAKFYDVANHWRKAGFSDFVAGKSYDSYFQEPKKLSEIYDAARKLNLDLYQVKKKIGEMCLREKFGFKNGYGYGNYGRSLIIGVAKRTSSAAVASKETGVSQRTILRYWRERSLHEETRKNNYDGNPFVYYKEMYGSRKMSRRQLREEDPNLCRALIRYGQIDLAIPEFRGYIATDKDWIIAFYERFKGNAVLCSKEIGRPRRTISKWWREANLPNSKVYRKLEREGSLDQITQKIEVYFKS
jgi:hypothetical protein